MDNAKDKKLIRNDLIMIAILLIGAIAGYFVIDMNKTDGNKVTVYVDGKEQATFDLNEDRTYEIKTDNGYNTLVIKDNKASVTEADCKDRLCVKQGEIDKNGETIVCLPHKVVVEVSSDEESDLDGIAE